MLVENTNITITKEQFEQFINIQEAGEFNMMSPEARMQTDLDKKQWLDIIRNYDKYASMFNDGCSCSSC